MQLRRPLQHRAAGLILALFGILGSQLMGQTTYTWTVDIAGSPSWTDAGNWDGNGVFVTGALNDLVFNMDADNPNPDTTGVMNIIDVPAALTMRSLTLSGRGPNSTTGLQVNIGDNSSTWTIGDGASASIVLNMIRGGGTNDRILEYNINPNIVLDAPTTNLGDNSVNRFYNPSYIFAGNIGEATAGNGINLIGNQYVVFSGNNTYTGATTLSNGNLLLTSANAISGGLGFSGGLSNLTLNGGVVDLGFGDLQRGLGTGSDQFQITGGTSGFSAVGGDRTITVNNDASTELVWGSTHFNASNLVLNDTTADSQLTLTNNIDLGSSTRTIQVNAAVTELSGIIQGSGAELRKSGGGTLRLIGSNTFTNDIRLDSGTLSIETLDNLGVGGELDFNNGTLQIRGTGITSLSQINAAHTVNIISGRTVGLDIEDRNNTFTADFALNQGSGQFRKDGAGTLIINQASTYTGNTTIGGGGTLILDYTSEDNAKISTGNLSSSGSNLILRGGTHAQTVGQLSLGNNGGQTNISRDGGTATINLNNISRGTRTGTALAISEDGLATTTLANNSYGILDGWATVGSNWATNDGSGNIVGLTSYTTVTSGSDGGSSTANLQLTGGQVRTTQLSGNTLRISNSGNSQVLDIGSTNLRISNPNADGGLLYAGGFDNNYTITGTTGQLSPLNGSQELTINTFTGTLTIDARVLVNGSTSAPLSKNGAGTLVLNATNNYAATTFVNDGTLLINGDHSSATGDIRVHGSTFGGSGTIGGNIVVRDGGTLSPGNSPGILTMTGGDLLINSTNAQIFMEIQGTGLSDFDQVVGIGNFDMGGDLVLELSGFSVTAGDSWNLFDFASQNGDFESVALSGDYNGTLVLNSGIWSGNIGGLDWSFDSSSGVLSAVPEPSMLSLVGLGGLLLLRRRRA